MIVCVPESVPNSKGCFCESRTRGEECCVDGGLQITNARQETFSLSFSSVGCIIAMLKLPTLGALLPASSALGVAVGDP